MSYYIVTKNQNVFGPANSADEAWSKLYELENGSIGAGNAVVARASDANTALAKAAGAFSE